MKPHDTYTVAIISIFTLIVIAAVYSTPLALLLLLFLDGEVECYCDDCTQSD